MNQSTVMQSAMSSSSADFKTKLYSGIESGTMGLNKASARRSIIFDSSSPYYTGFTKESCANAVYFTGTDPLFGDLIAVVYESRDSALSFRKKLSTLLISSHGTSGFLNVTLNTKSRYFSACENLPDHQKQSMIRKALAITCLRSFATMDKQIKDVLTLDTLQLTNAIADWDETNAGLMASRLKLATGKYPQEIGDKLLATGILEPKFINTAMIDVVYIDRDSTIEKNNELVYLLGDQLEQLFDPLSEYSPEPTERLYTPPAHSNRTLKDDDSTTQAICQELYTLQSHFRNDLVDFLQEFLIPLRVNVLDREKQVSTRSERDEQMTIRKLNTLFPPTIDEIVRINNIFYEALQQAVPFGSFEVLKACGMSIPYFYKACMRHEAGTRNFFKTLSQKYDSLKLTKQQKRSYSPRKIESIIHCSIHLTKIKMILDRLMKSPNIWTQDEVLLVDEYYSSAVGTIDAFGKQNTIPQTHDRRIFTPTGKVLVELAKGWPKELEYGWIDRRVVTIFDAIDVLDEHYTEVLHSIVILFTDQLVILRPNRQILTTSASGIYIPSIADVLMHSMINEAPLNRSEIPELTVEAWAAIEDVHMAEYNMSKNLAILVTGNGLQHANSNSDKSNLKLFELVRPDQLASTFVGLSAKAKVMNKKQPFHLFKSVGPQMSMYATVHELQGYSQETHKCPIALFMNVEEITRDVLEANELSACFKVRFQDDQRIRLQAFSKLGYEFDRVIVKEEFAKVILSETAYLYTLFLSTSNKLILDHIMNANRSVAGFLTSYAVSSLKQRPYKRGHHPNVRKYSGMIPVATEQEEKELGRNLDNRMPSLFSKLSLNRRSSKTGFQFLRVRQHSPPVHPPTILPVIGEQPEIVNEVRRISGATIPKVEQAPEMVLSSDSVASSSASSTSSKLAYEFPRKVDKKRSMIIYSNSSDRLRYGNIASDDEGVEFHQNSEEWEDIYDDNNMSTVGMSTVIRNTDVVVIGDSTNTPEHDSDVDKIHQRDVESWFKDYESVESGSLNSINELSPGVDDVEIEEIYERRLTQFLDRGGPSIRSFAADPDVHVEEEEDEELEEEQDDESFVYEYHHRVYDYDDDKDENLSIVDDFAYLAGLVGDNDSIKPIIILDEDRRLYPDLRDTSIVFLGSYVHSRQASSSGSELAIIKEESNLSSVDSVVPTEAEWFSSISSSRNGSTRTDPRSSSSREQIHVKNVGSRHSSQRSTISSPAAISIPLSPPLTPPPVLTHGPTSTRSNSKLNPYWYRHNRTASSALSSILRYSSTNTLQLVSFTIELDRLMAEAKHSSRELQDELELVKRTMMSLYEKTRNLIIVDDEQIVLRGEQESRKKIMSIVWVIIGLIYDKQQDEVVTHDKIFDSVLKGILDMEMTRRGKLQEKLEQLIE